MFKKGDKVRVLRLYNGTVDGFGVVLGPSKQHGFKGQWLVEVEGLGTNINIESERLMLDKAGRSE